MEEAGARAAAATSRATSIAVDEQPRPVPSDRPVIQELVIEDMRRRLEHGVRTYGTGLQAFNGRDALVDAYQECMDLLMYLRQMIAERDTRQ